MTQRRLAPPRLGGRRYIGPKAQTAVPDEDFLIVEKEAEERGVNLADVWREIIDAGMEATGRRLGSRPVNQ